MRKTYVQIDGVLYEKGTEPSTGVMIMPDIQPYRSMITGEIIASRSKHREHLNRHGCTEVGNEIPQPKGIPAAAPQQRLDLLRAQFDAMRHDDFKQMVKRDLDRVRWNSRER